MKPTPELQKLLEQGRQELAEKRQREKDDLRRMMDALQNAIYMANTAWLFEVRSCIPNELVQYVVVPTDDPFERKGVEYNSVGVGRRAVNLSIGGLAPIRILLEKPASSEWKLASYGVADTYKKDGYLSWSFNLSSAIVVYTLPEALAIAEERFAEFEAGKENAP